VSDQVRTALARIDRQLAPWTNTRYARILASGLTGGDTVHGLVQAIADLAAVAEGQPLRPVPRIGDVGLRDQLRVVTTDLLAADPSEDTLIRAADAIRDTARALDQR
jgi:hypothetical protein